MTTRKINHIFILIILFGFINIFSSCNKNDDSQIGLNIIPESDNISLRRDTIGISCYTVKTDKISIDYKTLVPLGSYVDPIFGFSKASCAFQLKLPSNKVVFNARNVVSLELHLKIQSVYGDSLSQQTVHINRLLTDLDASEAYTSDFKLNTGDYELLQTSTFTYNHSDTAKVIKLQLPLSLAESFVDKNNAAHFTNDSTFLKFFKGLFLTTENAASGGAIFSFTPINEDSKLVLTYNDTTKFSFGIDSKCAVVKMLEHDYSSASPELSNVLEDSTLLYDYGYVQGLAGLRTKIEIPELDKFKDSSNISINRAKLTLNLKQDSYLDNFQPPEKLTLLTVADDGKLTFIEDQILNSNAFDGSYNSKDQTYSFNISIYIQEILRTKEKVSLYLIPTPIRNEGIPNRAVFHANSNDEKSPKLEIFYSIY